MLLCSVDNIHPFLGFVHPLHAKLLSFFTGENTLDECLSRITLHFDVTRGEARRLVSPLLYNGNYIQYRFERKVFSLPPYILVPQRSDMPSRKAEMESLCFALSGDSDYERTRLKMPVSALLVINTCCVTDCIYCYADRRTRYVPMSTAEILQTIERIKESGVLKLDISGGEFFLQKDWDVIGRKLVECGYQPEISTKRPLTHDEILRFKSTGLKSLQFSLDSVEEPLLMRTLGVKKGYLHDIQRTISELDEIGIEIIIKPTLCRHTCTIKNVMGIVSYASTIKHIKRCVVTIMSYSHYKGAPSFLAIQPTREQMEDVRKFIHVQGKNLAFPLISDSPPDLEEHIGKQSAFQDRSVCTANTSGFVVLPDGKVTICEELYWNENFILGNALHDDINSIWNSEKALKLWDLKPSDFPQDSACKRCAAMKQCRKGKGVCWKHVIKAYGEEHWLYPDPSCPKSPKPYIPCYYAR